MDTGTRVDFAATLWQAARERIAYVTANRERLVEAWVAETGLLPSESVLVEKHEPDGALVVYVRKRQANEWDE